MPSEMRTVMTCGGKFTSLCVLFSRLVSGNIPTGHFTHVFVDEAGHAVETECIVPLAGEETKSLCFFFFCHSNALR